MSTERFLAMASACCLATLVAGGAPTTEPDDCDPTADAVATAPTVNYKNLGMTRINPRMFTARPRAVLAAASPIGSDRNGRFAPSPMKTRPATLSWVSDADTAAAATAEWRHGATFRF